MLVWVEGLRKIEGRVGLHRREGGGFEGFVELMNEREGEGRRLEGKRVVSSVEEKSCADERRWWEGGEEKTGGEGREERERGRSEPTLEITTKGRG